jgi:hypothetical protein
VVAATVLATTIFAAGCHRTSPKPIRAHLGYTFQDSKTGIDPIYYMSKEKLAEYNISEDEQKNALRRLREDVISDAKVDEYELRKAPSAERKVLLSRAVGRLERRRLGEDGLSEGSHALDSTVRREDSLFLVKSICETDSESLFKDVEWDITSRAIWMHDSEPPAVAGGGKKPHVNAVRWRDSLISVIRNGALPMLPEASERRHDSLLLFRAITAHVEMRNQVMIDNIFRDSTHADENAQDPRIRKRYLDIYENMKLPDDRTRKGDMLQLGRGFALLQKREKIVRENYNYEIIMGLFDSTGASYKSDDPKQWKRCLREALRTYEKRKKPDGLTREMDLRKIDDCFRDENRRQDDAYEEHLEEEHGHVSNAPPPYTGSGPDGNGIERCRSCGRE